MFKPIKAFVSSPPAPVWTISKIFLLDVSVELELIFKPEPVVNESAVISTTSPVVCDASISNAMLSTSVEVKLNAAPEDAASWVKVTLPKASTTNLSVLELFFIINLESAVSPPKWVIKSPVPLGKIVISPLESVVLISIFVAESNVISPSKSTFSKVLPSPEFKPLKVNVSGAPELTVFLVNFIWPPFEVPPVSFKVKELVPKPISFVWISNKSDADILLKVTVPSWADLTNLIESPLDLILALFYHE